MKTKLKNLLDNKIAQRDALNASMIEADSKEERAAIGATLKALSAEIADVEAMLADVDAPAEENAERKFSPVASMQMRTAKTEDNLEYRKAFQKYMATGKMEARADATTATGDISAVIPENLVNRILEKYEQLGTIYNLVTKTAYPVGQAIPVDGVKPTATWVGRNASALSNSTNGEGATSDAQKKTLGASIVFANFKLRCEIRYTEEVATMALPAFEELFVRQVGEAMLRAQESAIVEGDGYGMPAGILNSAAVEGQAIELANAEALTYEKLCEVEGAIPVEFENGAKWVMTKKTFMAVQGMVDQQGQPIARVNYGMSGKPERSILGREVVIYAPQAGSKMKNLSATSASGDIVAFVFDFADYVLNTNYDLGISHARDWDNEDHKTKAVLACDGKVIDNGSLVTLAIK